MMGRPQHLAPLGLILACVVVAPATGQRFNHNSYVGRKPPELVSQNEHWLGWNEKVTLSDLEGQVVWLQFNF